MTELETILLKSLIETREACLALLRCLAESENHRSLRDYLPNHCYGFGRRSDEAIALAQERVGGSNVQ